MRGAFTCNQVSAALEACVEGLGFAQVLCYQALPLIGTGRLTIVLRDFEPPPVPVSLVRAEARLASPRLRAFLDWMRERLRERPVLQEG